MKGIYILLGIMALLISGTALILQYTDARLLIGIILCIIGTGLYIVGIIRGWFF